MWRDVLGTVGGGGSNGRWTVVSSDTLPEDYVFAIPSSPPISPTLLPISDSDILLPPIANLCVAPSSVNSDFFEDAYNWCDLKPSFPFAFASTISQHLVVHEQHLQCTPQFQLH